MTTSEPVLTSGALFRIGFLILIGGGILNFLIYGLSSVKDSVAPLAFLSGYNLWLIPVFAVIMMVMGYAVESVKKSKSPTDA
jgi:uncharacterized membrane protein